MGLTLIWLLSLLRDIANPDGNGKYASVLQNEQNGCSRPSGHTDGDQLRPAQFRPGGRAAPSSSFS